MGTERLEATAGVAPPVGNEGRRECAPRRLSRPAAVLPDSSSKLADYSEAPPHQIDSLA